MKQVAGMFSQEARRELEQRLGIVLEDTHDYTPDELEGLYDIITDRFPYAFAADGTPQPMGALFEQIIDVFVQNRLVEI